jgi:hypothetical protein
MRHAQWISGAIYLSFVGLATVLLGTFRTMSETGIIDLSAQVAFLLPFLLILGASLSQFSAAVADTLASGGLIQEATYDKVDHRHVYVAVMVLAILLLWTSHIFEIIAYASRAFAAYYGLQCAIATLHSAGNIKSARDVMRTSFFVLLTLIMAITAIFGIPAESVGG